MGGQAGEAQAREGEDRPQHQRLRRREDEQQREDRVDRKAQRDDGFEARPFGEAGDRVHRQERDDHLDGEQDAEEGRRVERHPEQPRPHPLDVGDDPDDQRVDHPVAEPDQGVAEQQRTQRGRQVAEVAADRPDALEGTADPVLVRLVEQVLERRRDQSRGDGDEEHHLEAGDEPSGEDEDDRRDGGGEQEPHAPEGLRARETGGEVLGRHALFHDREGRTEAQGLPGLREEQAEEDPGPGRNLDGAEGKREVRCEEPEAEPDRRDDAEQREGVPGPDHVRDPAAWIGIDRADDVLERLEDADDDGPRPQQAQVLGHEPGGHLEGQREGEHREREDEDVAWQGDELPGLGEGVDRRTVRLVSARLLRLGRHAGALRPVVG